MKHVTTCNMLEELMNKKIQQRSELNYEIEHLEKTIAMVKKDEVEFLSEGKTDSGE